MANFTPIKKVTAKEIEDYKAKINALMVAKNYAEAYRLLSNQTDPVARQARNSFTPTTINTMKNLAEDMAMTKRVDDFKKAEATRGAAPAPIPPDALNFAGKPRKLFNSDDEWLNNPENKEAEKRQAEESEARTKKQSGPPNTYVEPTVIDELMALPGKVVDLVTSVPKVPLSERTPAYRGTLMGRYYEKRPFGK